MKPGLWKDPTRVGALIVLVVMAITMAACLLVLGATVFEVVRSVCQ